MIVRVLLFLLICAAPLEARQVTDYSPVRSSVTKGSDEIALRTFVLDGQKSFLAVDPWTLAARVVQGEPLAGDERAIPEKSPYAAALARYGMPPYRLQNHGLTRALTPLAGQFVTVDLCPSSRPFEKEFFTGLASQHNNGPVHVAIAVSGSWLMKHAEEFRWLQAQEQSGKLSITWVNHSMSHPFDPRASIDKTFLLTPGTVLQQEILGQEQLLLEHGVTPSPFFRLPGLVGDQGTYQTLSRLGLIPLGSDAWLAKGEKPGMGSIILVHGNGNEPSGIRKFAEWEAESQTKRHYLPLQSALTGTFNTGAPIK